MDFQGLLASSALAHTAMAANSECFPAENRQQQSFGAATFRRTSSLVEVAWTCSPRRIADNCCSENPRTNEEMRKLVWSTVAGTPWAMTFDWTAENCRPAGQTELTRQYELKWSTEKKCPQLFDDSEPRMHAVLLGPRRRKPRRSPRSLYEITDMNSCH